MRRRRDGSSWPSRGTRGPRAPRTSVSPRISRRSAGYGRGHLLVSEDAAAGDRVRGRGDGDHRRQSKRVPGRSGRSHRQQHGRRVQRDRGGMPLRGPGMHGLREVTPPSARHMYPLDVDHQDEHQRTSMRATDLRRRMCREPGLPAQGNGHARCARQGRVETCPASFRRLAARARGPRISARARRARAPRPRARPT